MSGPTERDIKKLFALSMNQCAFPDCINSIFSVSDEMIGEVCHIHARQPGGPRFNPLQSEEERHGFSNLVLLCRNHHKVVDDNPDKYTADWLRQIKRAQEAIGGNELSQHEAKLARRLLDSLVEAIKSDSRPTTTINQTAKGKSVTQVAGDYHHYEQPPKQKITVTPPAGAVSPAELSQIQSWIESLVDLTTDMSRERAFGMWRNRFKQRFKLTKSEQLLSIQMLDVEAWHRQQLAILKRGLKTKAPDVWRAERYKAIHMAMGRMGVNKLTYYAELSVRLKMKQPFTSLTTLTKVDLGRVYTMVLRDARAG